MSLFDEAKSRREKDQINGVLSKYFPEQEKMLRNEREDPYSLGKIMANAAIRAAQKHRTHATSH